MKTKQTPSITATLRAMKVGQHFVLPPEFPNSGPACYNAGLQIGATIRTMKTAKGTLVMLTSRPTVIKNETKYRICDGKVEFSGRGRPTLASAAKAKGKKAKVKPAAKKPTKKAVKAKPAPKKAKVAVRKPKTRKLNATEAANAAAAL